MRPKRTMSRSDFVSSCDYNFKTIYETDDDRDSGTESDDEGAEIEELQKYMESIIHLDSRHNEHRRGRRHPAPPPPPLSQQQVTSGEGGVDDPPRHHRHHQHHRPRRRPPTANPRRSPDDAALDSALPSDSDHPHHSSEEELEVINSGHPPEKRKWVGSGGDCPVQFRTSPPAHAHKPGGKCSSSAHLHQRQADIPPHELCSVSPRKRHRRTPTTAIQRPCLDFEKMQQVMAAAHPLLFC